MSELTSNHDREYYTPGCMACLALTCSPLFILDKHTILDHEEARKSCCLQAGKVRLQLQPIHCQIVAALSCASYTVCYSAYNVRCVSDNYRNASQGMLKYWRSITYGRKVSLLCWCQDALFVFYDDFFSSKKLRSFVHYSLFSLSVRTSKRRTI